jgi:uncharacterized protein
MSTEENKKLAIQFFARLSANDVAGALGTLTDDVSWWIAGKPNAAQVSGTHDKAKITRVMYSMFKQLKDGMKMTVKSAIAEGDKVALEVESHGELKNGRVYNNEYHFLITLRDGKICAVKEYLDTQHVHATWVQP